MAQREAKFIPLGQGKGGFKVAHDRNGTGCRCCGVALPGDVAFLMLRAHDGSSQLYLNLCFDCWGLIHLHVTALEGT